ncbi:hypothetical protein R3I93_004680 [Phoxinus phoxinus]|uniref:Uncharacterized protein n=1 Tax=Phoxinus phoxinus TaxID=58324 RepID=A0AAN9DFZ2_9TELE
MAGTCSDEGTAAVAETRSRRSFCQFLEVFPVSLQGQPPYKRQRSDSGFPGDRALYDKWRVSQYAKRTDYLVGYFSLRRPSATKVCNIM